MATTSVVDVGHRVTKNKEDLAVRNQEGMLADDEREELFNYVKTGHLLALLHAKARKSLPKQKVR